MTEKTYIRKEVEELTGVPARRIQFYTENGVLSVNELRTGRGRERKYSRENILEILVIKELAKMRVEFAEIRRIVNKLAKKHAPRFFDIERVANSVGKWCIFIYADGTVVFDNLQDILENLGKYLFDLFSKPVETLKAFGNAIKENITNRFVGILEFLPQVAKSIGLLFQGEFQKAGQVALDAVAKVGLGVENFTIKAQKGFGRSW